MVIYPSNQHKISMSLYSFIYRGIKGLKMIPKVIIMHLYMYISIHDRLLYSSAPIYRASQENVKVYGKWGCTLKFNFGGKEQAPVNGGTR